MGKVSKSIKMDRINRVQGLLGMGYRTYQIIDICSGEWSVGDRTVKRYIAMLYKFLKLQLNDSDKEKILLEYEELIHKNELSGDKKYASIYRERRDKILGLYTHDVKADITSGGKPIDEILFTLITKKEDTDES